MKKRVIGLSLVLVLVLGMTGCGSKSENKEKETLRLGVTTGLKDHYIALIGEKEGFFEENGIDIELVEFATGIETIDATTSGQVDIGKAADFAIVNRIGNTEENFQGKLIGKFESSQNYALYVNPKQVSTLEDLKGKAVVTNPGTILDYLYALTYQKLGITENDVNVLNVSSGQEAIGVLSQNEAVAYWANGNAAQKIQEIGFEKLIGMEELNASVDDYYVASDNYIASNKTTSENFLKAVKETEDWIEENQSEAVKIIADKLGVEETLIQANLSSATLGLDFSKDTENHLEEIQEFNAEKGFYEKSYNIQKFINTEPLKNALPDAEIF